MPSYTYRYVPVPETLIIRGKESHAQVVASYEQLVNRIAAEGWEYVGVDTVESQYSRGCLQMILGFIPILNFFVRNEEAITFKMLIFRREV